MAEDRVTVPKGPREPRDHLLRADSVDNARLLKALQQMDENAYERAKALRLFLFCLPLLWGLTWGLLYFLLLTFTR